MLYDKIKVATTDDETIGKQIRTGVTLAIFKNSLFNQKDSITITLTTYH